MCEWITFLVTIQRLKKKGKKTLIIHGVWPFFLTVFHLPAFEVESGDINHSSSSFFLSFIFYLCFILYFLIFF